MMRALAGAWRATSIRRWLAALLLALAVHAFALAWLVWMQLLAPPREEAVLVLHASTAPDTDPAPLPRADTTPARRAPPSPPRSAARPPPPASDQPPAAPAIATAPPVDPATAVAASAALPTEAVTPALAPALAASASRAPQEIASTPPSSQATEAGATPMADRPPDTPGAQEAGDDGLQAPAPRLSLPASARLRYELTGVVRGLTYYAHGTLDWQHDGASYQLRMDIGAFLLGSRVQASEGEVSASGLRPRRFSDRVHSERTVTFDPAQGVIRFSEGADPVPWSADAQDALSVFVQLGSLLLGSAPAYAVGETLELTAVGVYGPERWVFRVEPDEVLVLDGQAVATRKVRRAATRDDEPSIELWFAPAWGGLPVRIRLTQGEGDTADRIDQVLSSRSLP